MTGRRRGNPEAEIQRALVTALRIGLPAGSIVHHSANEQRGGDARARLAQSIGVGMGVHPGFSDLIVISGGRVLFLEIKTATGQLTEAQREFRDAILAQRLPYAVVRDVGELPFVLEKHGFRSNLRGWR